MLRLKVELKSAIYFVVFLFVLSYSACTAPVCDKSFINSRISAALQLTDSDAVSALRLLEEAYDALGTAPDSSLLRQIHYQKGQLFLKYGLSDECIESMAEAYAIDSARRDTFAMYYDLRFMAYAHETAGRAEVARATVSIAKDDIYDLPMSQEYIYARLQEDYFIRYKSMIRIKEKLPEEYLEQLVWLTPNSPELEMVLHAWEAESSGDTDMAMNYYNKITTRHSSYVKAFALLRLAELHLSMNQMQKVADYLVEYRIVFGQIRRLEKLSKQLLQVRATYQERRAHNEIEYLEFNNSQQRYWIFTLSLICIFIVTLVFLLQRNYRQRQQIIKFRLEKLQQWRLEYMRKSEQVRIDETESEAKSEIYSVLRGKLETVDSVMSSDEWSEIEKTILLLYPDFRNRLFELCKLSTHEYHVCLLLKISMKPSEIALLTSHSNEAISSTRRRLYARVYGKKGTPKEWDEVIKTL